MGDATNLTATILVPVDGSEASEQAARYAANTFGTTRRLLLLHVLNSPSDDELEEASRELESLATRIGSHIRCDVRIDTGNAADRILVTAEEPGIEMIVMATRGRGAAGRALFGSTADRVSRHAARPVLLIRGDETPPPPDRLVIPLDGSARSEAALRLGSGLADSLRLPVTLVRVVDLDDVLVELRSGRIDRTADDAFELARAKLHAEAERYLAQHSSTITDETTTIVLGGTPAHVLLDFFEPNDLVVMTSRGLGGAQRWLLGSTAEKLIRESPAPVLLVPSPAEADA